MKGQWIVCIYDTLTTNTYLGVFRSSQKAEAVASRLNRDIGLVGAEEMLCAIPEWVDPDVTSYRDGMLNELARRGYR